MHERTNARAGVRRHGGVGWAIAADGPGVVEHAEPGGAIVIAGRPRWRGSLDPGESLATAILRAYRATGLQALEHLQGAFALALAVDDGRESLVAIDRVGIATLTWCAAGGGLLFGTTADLVNACAGERPGLDPQSLFNYVFLHMVPGPATVFRGQRRLPPGGYVRVAAGLVEEGTYWRMHFDDPARHDLPALKREFLELVERGVAARVGGVRAGCFLSGGTDSSTIAGMLGRVTRAPARTYSIGFEAAGYDEVEYARMAARHFRTDHHEYYVTPAEVTALAPRIAAYWDQPFGNASAVPTHLCAQLARADGIELLLGGDGGDELFGGNDRYATQAMLAWYERVPRMLRRSVVEPLLERVPGADRIGVLRKARGYVRQATTPMPERMHAYNMVVRTSAEAVFCDDFLATVAPDTPAQLFGAVYRSADARGWLNRVLAVDLRYTLADNDLRKVSSMCDLAGVAVDYPLLDDDLMAFSGRLPAALKLKGLRLRWFFKEALRGFLPDAILRKRKHGFGLPIGVWMRTHAPLRTLMYDAVDSLASRGIVRRSFVERLIAHHRADAPAYWGGEIWVLAQLELWLQAHATPGASAPHGGQISPS